MLLVVRKDFSPRRLHSPQRGHAQALSDGRPPTPPLSPVSSAIRDTMFSIDAERPSQSRCAAFRRIVPPPPSACGILGIAHPACPQEGRGARRSRLSPVDWIGVQRNYRRRRGDRVGQVAARGLQGGTGEWPYGVALNDYSHPRYKQRTSAEKNYTVSHWHKRHMVPPCVP
jgi:hypothetical protein